MNSAKEIKFKVNFDEDFDINEPVYNNHLKDQINEFSGE
jgi:hypothetical protein